MSQDNNQQQKNQHRRYIGKVRVYNGQHGQYEKILVDNPNPTKEDGTPNTYNKGVLLWLDNETQTYYQVKQLSLRGVPQDARQNGFKNSIAIDLDNAYEVTPMKK